MDDLLGRKQVVKATQVLTGDFLVGDDGLSTSEVIEVQTQSEVVLVNLAVRGVARLDPAWDVAVYRKSHEPSWDDQGWCHTCDRDTAFCLCICYVCDEASDDCQCSCAQCDTKVRDGGLCATHKASWNESVQGPEPETPDDVSQCLTCGIPFNISYERPPG